MFYDFQSKSLSEFFPWFDLHRILLKLSDKMYKYRRKIIGLNTYMIIIFYYMEIQIDINYVLMTNDIVIYSGNTRKRSYCKLLMVQFEFKLFPNLNECLKKCCTLNSYCELEFRDI